MKKYLVLISFLSICGDWQILFAQADVGHPIILGEISSPINFVKQSFDVLRYDLRLEMEAPLSLKAKGRQTVTLRWVDSSRLFRFHLRSLRVDSVLVDDVRASFVTAGEVLDATFHYVVDCSKISQSDTCHVVIHYSGTMTGEAGANSWGGVHADKTDSIVYALGVGFANNYVSTTAHWMPCYDHPSDKVKFSAVFVVPENLTVASNGILESNKATGNGSREFTWRHDFDCATYLLTFAVGKYADLFFSGMSKPAHVFSLAKDTAATRVSFSLLNKMVSVFEKRFGAYPFEKIGYVNTTKGVMEHQTMISFNTSLSRSRDTINSVGAHELAHQWFGDLVSPLDFRHAWLNESFATYCEALWREELGGHPAYLEEISSQILRYTRDIINAEKFLPLFDFPRKSPSSNYPSTIYAKGSCVLALLRYQLGDELFFNSLKSFLDKFAFSTATTQDLKETIEKETGLDMTIFFDQWVIGKGYPVCKLNISKQTDTNGKHKAIVTITQNQHDSLGIYYDVPLELTFKTAANTNDSRVIWIRGKITESEINGLEDWVSVTANRGPTLRTLVAVTSITSGVDARDDHEVQLFPNPASNELTVEVPESWQSTTVKIVDVRGDVVQNVGFLQNQNRHTFSLEKSASGVYLVIIQSNGKYLSREVVLSR